MQVVPSGGQVCNLCKWRHLVAMFATNASGANWWPILQLIEEERKTLKSTLDVDLNLSQHLMSTSQVNISCQHLMSIFQLDFPFLMPSISQYLEFNIYDCYFWVGFPVSAVKYFSKYGILHLRLHFWVGFPVSAVKYISIFQIVHLRLLVLGWISRFCC